MTYDEYIAQQQQAIDAERSPDGTGEALFYGRSDVPHCFFRSNCQVKAILHA